MANTALLHEEVFRRFVRPDGTMLDYADRDGNTVLPTPEECGRCIPNALGWMTAIENGAFFGGLYLYALTDAYADAPSPSLKADILRLAAGLVKLEDVGTADGFIARGTGTDGRCHYPFSSEDQAGPWLLGLWRLLRSGILTGSEAADIRARMLRTLHGIRSAGWRIPTEWPGVTRGSYAGADWRGASKLLFCAAVLADLTGDDAAQREYASLRDAVPGGSLFPRLGIVSQGFGPDMVRSTGLIQFWIDVCAHLCLRELTRLDPARAAHYKEGQYRNGLVACRFLDDYRRFEPTDDGCRVPDFHSLSREDCGRDADACIRLGGRHCGEIFTIFPARKSEHTVLGNMLFAAWIAGTCGDETVARAALAALEEACAAVDWPKLHLCYAFAAESAVLQTQKALGIKGSEK